MILLIFHPVFADPTGEGESKHPNTEDAMRKIKNDFSVSTDIPTWVIGDTWIYEADMFSDTENGTYDLSSDALNISVENRTTILHENQSVEVYILNVSGDISGTLDSSLFSGDVTGIITGTVIIRQADLSVLSTNISTVGILEWLFLEFDYEIASNAMYSPCFEYIDFPIKVNESWNISSTVHQNSSFYVETFYDNQSEGTASMNGNATCDAYQTISVPAGAFASFHLLSEGNGSIESWYNATVKNMVKSFMNQSNETETSTVYLNLTSFTLHNQSIDVTVDITPCIVDVDDDVTIAGIITDHDTGQPLPDANISITISYTDADYQLNADTEGAYTLTIPAPLLVDPTNTSYDIGSDGIIVSVEHNGSTGYLLATLTVTGIAIADIASIPEIKYETNPVNITCTIYTVNPLEEKIVNITGPPGFSPINVTLQPAPQDRYFYNQSYPIIGDYSFYLWAKENTGKTNKTTLFNFTVIPDTLPPTIQNITAIPNPQYANNSVNISCRVTDNVAIASVQLILSNPLGDISNLTMQQGTLKYYETRTYTIYGNYTYSIWTQDTLGNTNTSSLYPFLIIPDVTPPEILDQSPAVAFQNQSYTFQANITDNARVMDAYVEYWYGNEVHINESMTHMQDDVWMHTINILDTNDTLYYLISANDSSNNWNNTGIQNVTVLAYEVEDLNQSVFNRGFPIRHAADGDWAGAQNFIPTLNTLTKTELYLRKFGTPEFNLTVELRVDHPQGLLLDVITFSPGDVPSTWTWFEVDVEDQDVGAGSDVFIVCPPAPGGVTTSFGYEWGYAFGNQYNEGSFWFTRDGGGLWRDLPTMYEFVFKTYGHA